MPNLVKTLRKKKNYKHVTLINKDKYKNTASILNSTVYKKDSLVLENS